MPEELYEVHSEIMSCTKCELHAGRTNAVPGEGPVRAKVMFVGEGPGEKEDREGRPFIGAAGKYLTELLATIGLDRSQVFITNIVKCRPPNNRAPRQGEIDSCNPYLQAQIRLVQPKIICPLGTPAIKTVMGTEFSAGQIHGKPHRQDSRTVLPLYHPAAALYDSTLKDLMVEDFKVLKELLREETGTPRAVIGNGDRAASEPLQKWL